MQLLLAKGCCGMTPRDGSIVGGLYFMMVGVMQLVFEAGNLRIAMVGPANGTNGTEVPAIGIYCYYSLIALELVCIVMAGLLLASTWTRRFLGILAFGTWLILFDLALVAITTLLQVELRKVGLKLDTLAWCGVACRIITDPFWLAFVITHGLKLREEKTQQEGHRRRATTEGVAGVVKFKGFDIGI
ncbi:hypothetical protein AALO_G00168300 [Alosa alosa]|uniref:Uncharacterized protein n=1 Tax=Alosa alosa TaxID=278164 RepID=A0AAV6GGW5_9TELE|nr:hypothetical protein AALO_G00168300 [Alosa alosa]